MSLTASSNTNIVAQGGMHNRQGLTLKLLWDALMDYDLWPLYAISWTMLIPTNPVTAYLTLNLKALGFGTFETNLLTIPGYVLFLAHLILISWYSEKINNRMALLLYYSFWCFVLLLTLELLPANASPWAWYSATILMIGFPYIHSINGKHEETASLDTPLINLQSVSPRETLALSAPEQWVVPCTT
jgi:hypothetical protein